MEKSDKVVFLGYALTGVALLCSSIEGKEGKASISWQAVGCSTFKEAFDFVVNEIKSIDGKVIVGVEKTGTGFMLSELLLSEYEHNELIDIRPVALVSKPKQNIFHNRKAECLSGILSLIPGANLEATVIERVGKLRVHETGRLSKFLSAVCSAYSVMDEYEHSLSKQRSYQR